MHPNEIYPTRHGFTRAAEFIAADSRLAEVTSDELVEVDEQGNTEPASAEARRLRSQLRQDVRAILWQPEARAELVEAGLL